ncbi:MAG: beta-propeller fold lactonase family protein, partial [Silvibacterium sp.]
MRRAIESMSMLFVMATLLLPIHAKANNDFNDSGHAVFIMSNSVDRNEVIAFAQAADGTLHESGRFPTGGRGSGGNNDPLESQGSLTLSQDHPLLFALNAGSGQISVFDVHGSHLELSDKVQSEGSEPNAIAQHGNGVYVLNTGGSSNVAGFVLEGDHRHYIKNSLSFL